MVITIGIAFAFCKLGVIVLGPPQSQIGTIRGGHGRGRIALVGVGVAQHRPLLAQQPVDLLVLPRVVAELERGGLPFGQEGEEIAQPRRVLLEEGRKLEQHGEALAADEEALALWQALAAANPAHQPNLAGALTNYGAILPDLGRHREALAIGPGYAPAAVVESRVR